MAQAFTTDLHRATTWSIVLSVLMIIAGILAIASPYYAGLAITVVVGWLLLFSAVLHLVYAFRGGRATAVIWEILLAIVYALIGFYILAVTSVRGRVIMRLRSSSRRTVLPGTTGWNS